MITIVTCTYFSKEHRGEERMENCRASIQSWIRLLKYPEIAIHVADDGSDADLWQRFCEYHRGIRITYSQQQRQGIGASLNAGLDQAWSTGLALYIQDDLLLEQQIDLTFPASVLRDRDYLAAVRIGLPHPNTTGEWEHWPNSHRRDSMAMILEPHHYVMTFRPFLAHRRMQQLGQYLIGVSAEQCERDFNERFCRGELRVAQWFPSPWYHQHVVDLGRLEPCT